MNDVDEQKRHFNYNNSNNWELCWIPTSQNWIILRQSFSSGAHLDWGGRKLCVYGLLGKSGWHRAGVPWI